MGSLISNQKLSITLCSVSKDVIFLKQVLSEYMIKVFSPESTFSWAPTVDVAALECYLEWIQRKSFDLPQMS